MKLITIALLTIATGCGGSSEEPSADNHGYGWEFDAVSRNGLRLRQPGATNADADFLEAIAETVEQCAGLDAPPPPFVIVVPTDSLGQQRVALYMSAPPLILIDAAWFLHGAYQHEVLHYLIDWNTGHADLDHMHVGFSTCVLSFPH